MPADSLCIHSAPWVVPVCRPIIADGGVVLSGNTIVAVDGLQRLQQQYPTAEIIPHPASALTPALINAHIHLELSHLAELAAVPFHGRFTDWISRLLHLRDTLGATGNLAEHAAAQMAEIQYNDGVSVLADIGNTLIGRDLEDTFPGKLFPFKEYLGLAEFTLEKNLHRLQQEPETTLCSGHAPYSTHGRLLQQLKKRAASLDHIFPIHTAEPASEAEMLGQGKGEMVEFIRQRGFWDGSFIAKGEEGSVQYLHKLGLLDSRTLCIHAIHVSREEIRILAGEGAKVCLCPGSNRFLGTGKAPVRQYLENGLLPALGTDSPASNPELSIWREMRILAEEHEGIDAAAIFAMATQGGAEALGRGDRLGTLEPRKDADLLIVSVPHEVETESQVYEFLVTTGSTVHPARIEH